MLLATAAAAIAVGVAGCSARSADDGKDRDYEIAVTAQGTNRILVFDAAEKDWSREEALRWSWAPEASNGFENLTYAWGLPTEAKVRSNEKWGGEWMVVTDSKGLAAIIPYPAGDRKQWGLNVGGNPHSAELLPSGNIAVAASSGGWVRVYTSSQGPESNHYAEYGLPAAHAALWDPDMNVLWSAGKEYLVALTVGGTDAEPTLEEALRIELPTKNAHAVEPVYGDADKLWVVTGSKVYQFSKSTRQFDLSYPGNEEINRVGVKGISNQLSGQVVQSVTDKAKQIEGGCTANTWCTYTVDFFLPADSRTVPGSELYKARILNPNYG